MSDSKAPVLIQLVIFFFGLASLWDGFTTFHGTANILANNNNVEPNIIIIISSVFAIIILGFMWSTVYIWEMDGFSRLLFIVFWFVAVGYDLYTSYIGNLEFIMRGQVNDQQFIVLVGITLLISGSPIFVSLLSDQISD